MTRKALPELTFADVFITDELDRRAPKKTDYLQEKLALQDLAARMADQPEDVLPRFVDLALEMTGGVSAGLSLYEEDPAPGVFRWQYLRGVLAPFNGATTPRDFSPCGITLDRNAPVLSRHPELVYDWIAEAKIVVPEVLLVPLYLGGKAPLGTLWIVSDREGHFDSGHARAMTELAAFVGIALRMVRTEQRLNTALEAQARDAEMTLRSSEEQFKRLVQGVTDYSLYMLTPDGKVASWNAGAQRIKGYTPDEIIGQHFSRFYTKEDQQNGEPERALATARREGRFEKEGWRVRKNGERFWANVVIDAIREGEGEIIGFAKITRDITEQRDARAALDRTREALFQSQKMEAVGQLTGGIAHDFNNLLTAVMGSLEIASRRVSDQNVKRLIDNAMRGAERGAALTQRMLVFARRQELNTQPVDIPALVLGMRELVDRSLGPSVLVETRFPVSLQWVNTDPNQLEMALLNLMVNARDAMPQGGPIIVAARSEQVVTGGEGRLRPGSYVCLSVTDAGAGMNEATLARAMDPFFTTKEVGKGTGLGLPMVHGLAQQSGGELVLKSRTGQGTTAELWLPVAEKSPVAATEPEALAPAKDTPHLTVLVVDDDPLVLTNMAAMLDDLGHTVFEATSALEALAILRRESTIELVLTDQAMPQMTGVELIEEIKTRWPKLPVILATGFADLPRGTDPLQITLAKPFLQYDLAQAVNQALVDPKMRRVVRFRGRR